MCTWSIHGDHIGFFAVHINGRSAFFGCANGFGICPGHQAIQVLDKGISFIPHHMFHYDSTSSGSQLVSHSVSIKCDLFVLFLQVGFNHEAGSRSQ